MKQRATFRSYFNLKVEACKKKKKKKIKLIDIWKL